MLAQYGLFSIPSGDAGTYATLNHMADLATIGAVTTRVRGVAASIVRGTGREPMTHAELLAGWIANHTEFLRDPSVAEALVPPGRILDMIATNGVAQIDCDDVAILAAALGLTIGLRARFVIAAFDEPNAPFAHVWTELGAPWADPAGAEWLTIDPTRPTVGLPPVTRLETMEV